MNREQVTTAPEVRADGIDDSLLGTERRATQRRVLLWCAAVILVIILLAVREAGNGTPAAHFLHPGATVLGLFLLAMGCEFIDSSLGMGYGTMLTPLLLLMGFEPLQVVPAILCSECVTGFTAAALHHRDGNVDFLRDRAARNTALWLSVLSAAGTIAAVALALSVPGLWLKMIIAVILLSVGVTILATFRRQLAYRRSHIIAIGGVAAFNKAISGGGYGPLVTAGQVVSGVAAKPAVAITSLAEALTCLIGVIAYVAVGKSLDLSVAIPMTLGALASVPMATLTVRQLPERMMRGIVGAATCVMGLVMLLKILL